MALRKEGLNKRNDKAYKTPLGNNFFLSISEIIVKPEADA